MAKKLFTIFVLIITFSFNIMSAYSENLPDDKEQSPSELSLILESNVLYRSESGRRTKLYDNVAAVSKDADTFYYIRSVDDKWIAGFFQGNSDVSIEFEIPGKYEKLYKFAGSSRIFYYLAEPVRDSIDQSSETKLFFVRFNPDQKNSHSIEGVIDFILIDGKSVVLKNGLLDYNGSAVPLMLSGNLKISGLIDSRIAVISGAEGTEMVDIIAEKNIYQYKSDSIPENSDEYNLILELNDKLADNNVPSENKNSIYYEILIDGIDENRTETGRGELSKIYHSKLVTGKYHIIKPERWELDKTKGRYTRMNNIYQPPELKVFIPENRVLRIKLEFGGTRYIINQSVLFK